jgi:hypothetical protein
MKEILLTILIIVFAVALITGLTMIEYKIDCWIWNDGECICGGEMVFKNASSHGNHDVHTYFYICENCHRLIELNSYFSK